MHRLLIADSDEVLLMAAKQAFSAEFEVLTCQDGETALELLSSFQPYVLIINLLLPFKDGLTVLQEAERIPPVTIATTPIILPYIEQACWDLQIGYLMVQPSLNALQVQVISMVNHFDRQNTSKDLYAQTSEILYSMGFPRQRIGCKELIEVIPLYFQDRDQCLDSVLYAAVGKKFDRSATAVERAIRAVIGDAWEVRDKVVWRKYFPHHTECPSNKAFFDAIADHLKRP